MEPENLRFGGGAGGTVLHPIVAVAMLLAIALIFLLPRRYVVVPLLFLAFLVPLGQVLVLGGIHVPVLRILVIFCCIRLIGMKLSSRLGPLVGGFNSIDKAFSLWAFFNAVIFVLQYMETGALINRVGFLVDAFGGYFLLRFLIRDDEDIRHLITVFAVIAGVLALCMLNEQLTQHNVFGLLGGHPVVSEIREGRIRSQGVFGHPLLAGTFGGTLLPLFVWLWRSGKSKATALVGMLSSTIIVVTTWTSTPLLTYAAGVFALCFWPLRKRTRILRRGIVITLVGLHLVMKAPVWALIARIDLTGSSSGYHRYMLVDNFIRKFGEWWLLGTKNYADWGWDMWDLSNGYVVQGYGGGLATFVCFVAIITYGFKKIGIGRKLAESEARGEWFFWCLSSALVAHVVAYFGTSYWDQTQFAWYAFLGIISAATGHCVNERLPQPEEKTELVSPRARLNGISGINGERGALLPQGHSE